MPSYCVSSDKKFYQYTAIDECTRFCFREMISIVSSVFSNSVLLVLSFTSKAVVHSVPLSVWTSLIGNGNAFIRFIKKSFELYVLCSSYIYHRIRVATPRHNGKVERQHRTDEKKILQKNAYVQPWRRQNPACKIQQKI